MRNRISAALVTSIALLATAAASSFAAPSKVEQMSEFQASGRAKKLNFGNWISIKHYGPEDKPLDEFIIAFASAASTTSVEPHKKGQFRIIKLPKIEEAPLFQFIRAAENSVAEFPGVESYRVQIFADGASAETRYMIPAQALKFFQQVDAVVQKYPKLGKRSQQGLDRMLRLLGGKK